MSKLFIKKAADDLTDDYKITAILNRIMNEPPKKQKLVEYLQQMITIKYIKMNNREIKNELYWLHTDDGALDSKKIIDDIYKIDTSDLL